MARVRGDYVFGTISTTGGISDSATSFDSAELARLPVVTAPDIAVIVFHDQAAGTYEVAYVTAHTAAATTATISRGKEGSTAQAWGEDVTWLHGPTSRDLPTSDASAPANPVDGQLWYDEDAEFPAITGADVTVDDSGFINISGADVQAALASADTKFTGLSSAVGSATTKYKAADESVANTTLQDDNDLFFAIGANQVWSVVWHLYVTNAASTADVKFQPSVPAGATLRYGGIGPASTLTTTEGDGHWQSVTSGALQFGINPASGGALAIVSATIENSTTAGTVNLQWAEQNTDATNATVVKRGSFMIAHRMV